MTQPIPNGYHTLTASFVFKDSGKAMEFYQKAFGAVKKDCMPGLDGKGVMHATMQIGNSMIMMGDAHLCGMTIQEPVNSPVSFYLYVPDVDKAFKQAVDAGAAVTMPLMDMFWGDRAGQIKDPFGYLWMLATHKKDLTQDQINQGAKEFFSKMSQQ